MIKVFASLIILFSNWSTMAQNRLDVLLGVKNMTAFGLKNDLPQWRIGEPVIVQVGFYIENLANLKPTEMSFDVDMYLELSYQDDRLKNDEDIIIITDPEMVKKFWVPDYYFANARKAKFHDVIFPNMCIRLYRDGEVQFSVRIVLTVSCNMNFRNYPFDKQHCNIVMLSYATMLDQLKTIWFNTSERVVDFSESIEQLPEMTVVSTTGNTCNGNYSYSFFKNKLLEKAAFSCLVADIHLVRMLGYHIIQTFFPTGLCVVISWASFWIAPTAVAARTSLCFTTLLALYTAANSIKVTLPQVSYLKAVDIWISTCIFFVFCSVIEYAYVNTLAHAPKMSVSAQGKPLGEDEIKFMDERVQKAKLVDIRSAYLFPLVFAVFNIIYWIYFLQFASN